MNRFFNRLFAAIDGTFARASAVRNEYQRIADGFQLVQDEIDNLKPVWLPTLLGPAYYVLRMNAAATAVEFVSPGRIPNISVTSSRALVASDGGAALLCSNASAMTITVPANATTAIDVETAIVLYQAGAGKVTIAPEAGVTLRAADGLLSTRVQFSQITLLKIATNEWIVGGDRAA